MAENKTPKDLYIFLTSKSPDIYINVIGYCIEHYTLNQVRLLEISEDRGQMGSVMNALTNFRDQILARLKYLQSCQYDYIDRCEKTIKKETK